MINLYQNRTPRQGPWGGGNLAVQAIESHAFNNQFLVNTGDTPDVLLAMGLDSDNGHAGIEELVLWQSVTPSSKKLFLRVNDCDARKGTNTVDDKIFGAAKHCTGVIFVSEWMQDYFLNHSSGREWPCINNTVIVNGVDQTIFKPGKKFENRKVNIVSHHWSDNINKSGPITSALDEYVGANSAGLTFTFIGRTNVELKNSKLIAPLYGHALGDELGKYDIYFSESLMDPGPNHILEGLACGLPTYVHIAGGGAVSFAGYGHTIANWEELRCLLERRMFRPNTQAVRLRSWEEFAHDVFKFMKDTQ